MKKIADVVLLNEKGAHDEAVILAKNCLIPLIGSEFDIDKIQNAVDKIKAVEDNKNPGVGYLASYAFRVHQDKKDKYIGSFFYQGPAHSTIDFEIIVD